MDATFPETTVDSPHNCKEHICEFALINKVKQHPHLYDFNHRDYKETRKCIQTWLKIALEIGIPGQWKICKERWRTLRDVYVRNRKSYLVGGERARKRPRWKFFDQMNFLHSYISHRAFEAENNSYDNRILQQGSNLSSPASDSDSNDAPKTETVSPTPKIPQLGNIKVKRLFPEDGSKEGDRDTKRSCLTTDLPGRKKYEPKRSAAVEEMETVLLREADPLAFTFDGRPIKQEVEWTDEEVDVVDKCLPRPSAPSPPPPTLPQPLPPAEDKKQLMLKLKLPGGKSIPATFITDPKFAFIKKKVGMIMPTPLKSVPIRIKTVTGSQLRTSHPPAPPPLSLPPLPLLETTPVLKEESKDNSQRASKSPTPFLEQVHKPTMTPSTDCVVDDEEELFGRYVAAAIRKLTRRSRSLAKMRIQQVLFHLEESDRTCGESGKDSKDNIMEGD